MIRLWLDWLFPSPCPGCGRRGGFCSECLGAVPPLVAGCPVCLYPEWPCPECRRRVPQFATVTALGAHQGILRDGLLALKYGGKRDLALPLGRWLGKACRNLQVDWVTSIPLHRDRLRERCYDQAEALGRVVACTLHRPYRQLLRRSRSTRPQQGLGLAEREANLANAFHTDRPLSGRLLLVDDVFTSGATCQEAARTLLHAGAYQVHVAVVARAMPV